jgi:hypothetical protein
MASPMETQVNRNLLRYACGTKIFCRCGQVLDAPGAVMISSSARTAVCCAKCFDAVKTKLPEGLDILDGRVLWS